jgi:protocatechuate 3,4-dioxygenase alpha subunit
MASPRKPLSESPSQTAGPYVHIGLMPNFSGIESVFPEDPGRRMVNAHSRGERIKVVGHIYDGEGAALTDAVVEIWQADAAGLFASPAESRGQADAEFNGWGRQACDPQTGEFGFDTIKPGRVPYPDGRAQAPHITLWIVARGINIGLHTRLYFDDEAQDNAADPVLARVEPAERRETLIARREQDNCYRFDIYLQGPNETVFFDI